MESEDMEQLKELTADLFEYPECKKTEIYLAFQLGFCISRWMIATKEKNKK
ncbi:MAG: hypothetical protein ABH804_00035 [archaeon]